MKKFIARFFITITILAAIAMVVYLRFFTYSVHIISQPFTEVENYDEHRAYEFVITDIDAKMISPTSSKSRIFINIYNDGYRGTSSYCDSSLTLVRLSDNVPKTFAIDTDSRQWASNQFTSIQTDIDLQQLGKGTYGMYFKVWDDTSTQLVPINNDLEVTKNGYYLGTISVTSFFF